MEISAGCLSPMCCLPYGFLESIRTSNSRMPSSPIRKRNGSDKSHRKNKLYLAPTHFQIGKRHTLVFKNIRSSHSGDPIFHMEFQFSITCVALPNFYIILPGDFGSDTVMIFFQTPQNSHAGFRIGRPSVFSQTSFPQILHCLIPVLIKKF